MKNIFIVIIILLSFSFAFAQGPEQKPLTQAEYVQMLYKLERNPSIKQEVIAALRTRGIDFKLTSGLKTLTRSKGRNDAELKRTIEEADRRRENPEAAKLPSKAEAEAVLEKTRQHTLAAVDDMPDFVVKQRIKRSLAYAGTGTFRSLDRLVVAVSYRASGQEEYRLLSKNGVVENNSKNNNSYSQAGGTSSTGEFVTVLATIFKAENETKFQLIDTDLVRKQRALVFDFSIRRDKTPQYVSAQGVVAESTSAGMKGKIWIDREKSRVLRIESVATEIPNNFPITGASRSINYDWVTISGEDYLLPVISDVRLTIRQDRRLYESRNLINFKDYQKFGTDVVILDDDDDEIIEGEKSENQLDKPKNDEPNR